MKNAAVASPENSMASGNYGMFLWKQKKEIEKAERYLSSAAKKEKRWRQKYAEFLYREKKDTQKAKQVLEGIIE